VAPGETPLPLTFQIRSRGATEYTVWVNVFWVKSVHCISSLRVPVPNRNMLYPSSEVGANSTVSTRMIELAVND